MAFQQRGGRRTGRGAVGRCLALLACASMGLSGCASASTTGNAAATGPLNVWVRGAAASLTAYTKLFAAFTAQTGIKVQLYGSLTDFETKVTAAASSHTLPDLVVDNASELGSFQSEGILEQVDPAQLTDDSQIQPTTWNMAKDSAGQTYAVPFSVQANLLFIRKDWLDKLHLAVPTTWAQVDQVAEAFTHDDPDGDGKADTYGLDIPGTTTSGYISWWWSSMLWQAGGDYVKSDGSGKYTSTLDSPQAVAAATEFENEVCVDKVAEPGMINDSTTDTNKAFETGVTGMYLTGPYAFATFDSFPAIKGKYIVVAPPTDGSGAPATLAEGTDAYLMQGAKSDEAYKLLSFMDSARGQTLGMTAVPTATVVRLPVNTTVNAATVHAGDPRWTLAEQVYADDGHFEYDSMPNWTALRQLTSNDLNTMIADCANPGGAMSSLNTQFQALLAKQGVAG
jgi:multiple sugar transport system substrate-binding protein